MNEISRHHSKSSPPILASEITRPSEGSSSHDSEQFHPAPYGNPLPAAQGRFRSFYNNPAASLLVGMQSQSPATDISLLMEALKLDQRILFLPAFSELANITNQLEEYQLFDIITAADKFFCSEHSKLTQAQMELFRMNLQKFFWRTGDFDFGFHVRDRILIKCIDDLSTGHPETIKARLIWLDMTLHFYPPQQKQDVFTTLQNILPHCAGDWFHLCKALMMACFESLDSKQQAQYISHALTRLDKPETLRIFDLFVAQQQLKEHKDDLLEWENVPIKLIRIATNFYGEPPDKTGFHALAREIAASLLILALNMIPDDPDLKRNHDFNHKNNATVCRATQTCYTDLISYKRIKDALFWILKYPDALKQGLPWQNLFAVLLDPDRLEMLKILKDGEKNPTPEIRAFHYITQIHCVMTLSDTTFPVAEKLREVTDRMSSDPDEQIRALSQQIQGQTQFIAPQ